MLVAEPSQSQSRLPPPVVPPDLPENAKAGTIVDAGEATTATTVKEIGSKPLSCMCPENEYSPFAWRVKVIDPPRGVLSEKEILACQVWEAGKTGGTPPSGNQPLPI